MVEFCVVNCCSCDTYQGQQVIKAKKWMCKMCGEKQSFRKIFGQGTGKECRKIVQQLNMVNGNLKQRMLQEEGDQEIEQTVDERNIESQRKTQSIETKQSKWDKFLPIDPLDATETENLNVNSIEGIFTTERRTFNQCRAQKRKKPVTKNIPSDNLNEYQARKKAAFDHSNEIYPKQSNMSKSNMTSKTATYCEMPPEGPPKNSGQIKVSKWSKFM